MPAAGEIALFGGNRARGLQLRQASSALFAHNKRKAKEASEIGRAPMRSAVLVPQPRA